ncbi:hypothetical protein BDN70DRAFT_936159 [Pholiota conissans]|uniref:Uncharacterized protein n=1 Tax=Pholiota conissans TaxID=109636 RepID=A0A9P6CWC0_9AGAR|nr:hypothetical protein BDN70DRAFT_936159 [Pholiota conissans]
MVTSSLTSSTSIPLSSSNKTHSRPPLGGNAGFGGTTGGANDGATPPTTTSSTTTSSPAHSTTPPLTTSPTPFPVTQVLSGADGNRSGNAANAGFDSTVGNSAPSAPNSALTISFPSSTSSAGNVKVDGPAKLTSPTISQGDSSISTTSLSSVTPQISASTIPTSSGPHRDLSSGIIAGIISVSILCLLVIGVCIHRRRKTVPIEEGAPESKDGGGAEIASGVTTHSQFKESALVFTDPNSSTSTSYAPTPTPSLPRSPGWLGDSNSDISQLSLPPPPPMVEIEDHPRAVPTLILDTSRYRRSHQPSPIDSRLSTITSTGQSGDSHRVSRSRRLYDDGSSPSFGAARSWSPSEAFCSSKPPVSFHSSGSSSRTSSRASFHVPPSPTNLRVPSSPTYSRSPPSPRTPPRTQVFIPPIPPLPKSPPPPVPDSYSGSYANPFVDRNPFDDPAG